MLEGAINFLGRTWGNLFHRWRKNTEIKLCTNFITPLVSIIEHVCMSFIRPCYHHSGAIGSSQSYCRLPTTRNACWILALKDPVSSWVREESLGEGMATYSSILAWETPWTEEPGMLHSPWDCKESDTTTPPLLVSPWVLFYPKTDASGTTTVGPWPWSQVCQVWGLEEGPEGLFRPQIWNGCFKVLLVDSRRITAILYFLYITLPWFGQHKYSSCGLTQKG